MAATLVVGALVAGGCGDGDDGEPPAALSVTALDNLWEPADLTTTAGDVEITVTNGGQNPHTFLVEGQPDVFLEVEVNGDTDTEVVELDAGTFAFYCDVPGHREDGMEGTLTVRES